MNIYYLYYVLFQLFPVLSLCTFYHHRRRCEAGVTSLIFVSQIELGIDTNIYNTQGEDQTLCYHKEQIEVKRDREDSL